MNTPNASKRTASGGTAHEDDSEVQSGRWLISYSDLVTTLMVLFLALYALQLARYKELEMKTFQQRVASDRSKDAAASKPDAARQQLLSLLEPLRNTGQISITSASHGVDIAINAKILFSSGDARLLPESVDVLNQIAMVLRDHSKNNILVEGHTDSAPISTAKYESNWELSSARAGAVVRFFVDRGIEARRMAAIGRADNFPLMLGDSAAARAANRRVTILVED